MSKRSSFIPFGRPSYSNAEVEAATRIIRSAWVGLGPETDIFEKELAAFCQSKATVLVNSCTSALTLSLHANGIGEGDEVIVPGITWYATANAALYARATPVLADIDRNTLNLTPETILACLTPRTKAVIVVHMGGMPVDVPAIRAALPPHILVIEDAAHAMGGRYLDGTPVGSSGNYVCFSFYANKNLSTGEGGLIAVGDPTVQDRLKSLRTHGMPATAWNRYQNPTKLFYAQPKEIGFKMTYMDLLAAIGRVQLAKLPEMQRHRQAIARLYTDFIKSEKLPLTPQEGVTEDFHAHHLYVVKLQLDNAPIARDALILGLREQNIGAALHYLPMGQSELYSEFASSNLENCNWLGERILTLPISSSMTLEDAHYVCDHLGQLLRGN